MATELTKYQPMPIMDMGQAFYESGMFPDIRSAAQAVVKIQAGAELGFPPIYAMTKIYLVKGKVMVGAEAIGAKVKSSGRYDYRVTKHTDTEIAIQFYERNHDGKFDATYLSTFSIEEAKKAGVYADGGSWSKWPKAMLFARAISSGARIVCPEVISGVYSAGDFEGVTIDSEGEIQQVVIEPEKPPVEKPQDAVSQAVGGQQQAPVVKQDAGLLQGQKPKATAANMRVINAHHDRLGDDKFWQTVHECKLESIANLDADQAAAIIGALSKVK